MNMSIKSDTIEGIPLVDLIGKKVEVQVVSGKTPVAKLFNNQTKRQEYLLNLIPQSNGDYELQIAYPDPKSKKLIPWFLGQYRILYSQVKISHVIEE